jgi:hypothetical protein
VRESKTQNSKNENEDDFSECTLPNGQDKPSTLPSVEVIEQPQGPSEILPRRSDLVTSPSMNLIDDSARHLFETMLTIGKKDKPDSADIKSVCLCAEQIHKLLRLKYDVLRIFGD